MPKFFVSYSHCDHKLFAKDFFHMVKGKFGPENLWYDQELSGGQKWWNEILQQIANCDVFVFLLSTHSVNSSYCKAEYVEAQRLRKCILPILIYERHCVSFPDDILNINDIQQIDMTDSARDDNAVERFVSDVSKLKIPSSKLKPLSPDPTPCPDPEAIKRAEHQQTLIRQAGSRSNDVAIEAVDALRQQNWLVGKNGALRGAHLQLANLDNANLGEANLQEAVLSGARLNFCSLEHALLQNATLGTAKMDNAYMFSTQLQHSVLWFAKINDAELTLANLQGAELISATLHNSVLVFADLKHALLHEAEFCNADLREADLQNAGIYPQRFQFEKSIVSQIPDSLRAYTTLETIDEPDEPTILYTFGQANFEGAIMPNGKTYTDDMDLEMFTNPKHPSFWRSNNPKSPAYKGDES